MQTQVIQQPITSAATAIDPPAAVRKPYALFILSFISTVLGGTVSTLMSVYLPVAVRDIIGNVTAERLNNISAYINAVFILGWAFGGFTWGVISDSAGRKKALLLATACYGIATVLTARMVHWEAIVLCRFISGFGVGGVLVTSFTFMSEVWPQRSKAIFIGILSIAIPVGIFSAGLINYIVADWRQGFFIGFVPIAIPLAGIWLLQESEVWKTCRRERAGENNQMQTLFAPALRANLLMGSITFGTMLIGLWAIFLWLPTWVQSLITAGDAQKERGLSMMLLGIGGLSGGFVSGWFANALGLRKAMICCFAACSLLSFVLFKTNAFFSPVIYAEIGLLALFFGASQGVLSAFIPQLFPTSIRASATGFCFNIGRLFTAAAVLSVGVLVTTLGGYGNALFIFSLVFVLGLFVMLIMKPNTPTPEGASSDAS
jgi:MFS family permease